MSSDEESDHGMMEEDHPLVHLPAYVVRRVERLRALDQDREALQQQYLRERAALERKYAQKYQPLYDERLAVIRGDKDMFLDLPEELADETDVVAGVPNFWVGCMTQHESIGDGISEQDIDCLEHIQNITCVDDEDGKGFTLRFHFAPNDYFVDEILTKRYEVPNLLLSDSPLIQSVMGCSIQWKEGRSLTERQVQKRQRGKGKNAGKVRTVTTTEDLDSFFRWFSPPDMPSIEDVDEQEAEELEMFYESDFDIALAFRNDIIPRGVQWFTGEWAEQAMFGAAGLEEDMEGLHVND